MQNSSELPLEHQNLALVFSNTKCSLREQSRKFVAKFVLMGHAKVESKVYKISRFGNIQATKIWFILTEIDLLQLVKHFEAADSLI